MQFDQLKRREFITLLGSAAWPSGAHGQQPPKPIVGFLGSSTPDASVSGEWLAALRQGLQGMGFIEDRNVTIQYRWAEGRYDRLPALAIDLVRRQVGVIAAFGPPAALAAKAATSYIPIVFLSGLDPVQAGLVQSLNRPGGNVTGFILFSGGLGRKMIELVGDLIPGAKVVGLLVNPDSPETEQQERDAREATQELGQSLYIGKARSPDDLEIAFAELVQNRVSALLIGSDPFLSVQGQRVVALAARHAIPTVHPWRESVLAGGLISYGNSRSEGYRQVGLYCGRILRGVKPADLPVQQPTKFELVINLTTAKALGLDVPPSLLVRADEVIE